MAPAFVSSFPALATLHSRRNSRVHHFPIFFFQIFISFRFWVIFLGLRVGCAYLHDVVVVLPEVGAPPGGGREEVVVPLARRVGEHLGAESEDAHRIPRVDRGLLESAETESVAAAAADAGGEVDVLAEGGVVLGRAGLAAVDAVVLLVLVLLALLEALVAEVAVGVEAVVGARPAAIVLRAGELAVVHARRGRRLRGRPRGRGVAENNRDKFISLAVRWVMLEMADMTWRISNFNYFSFCGTSLFDIFLLFRDLEMI